MTSGSLFRGEWWHTQLLTDTQVGKAIPARERQWTRGCWVTETFIVTDEMQQRDLPFFMSFSFLKIFPVSAMMKASPFSHRLSTETPAIAAPTVVFRASAGQDKKRTMLCFKCYVSNRVYAVLVCNSPLYSSSIYMSLIFFCTRLPPLWDSWANTGITVQGPINGLWLLTVNYTMNKSFDFD